jgi:flavin reductase (DIM6/NTAB) family NADH-FMN oxidoreductase RutF
MMPVSSVIIAQRASRNRLRVRAHAAVAPARRRALAAQVPGNAFNVNILKQGEEGPVMKALMKNFEPGEDRFGGVEHHRSDNGCMVLDAGVSVLQCEVAQRMDAGDHYLVYGTVHSGEVLDAAAVSAVHHRKAGNTY